MSHPDLKSLRAVGVVFLALLGFVINGARGADVYRENPGREGNGDFVIGPDYTVDPDLTDLGNPKGKSFEFTMPLADSRIFRGDDSTLEPEKKAVRVERKIFVYVPAAYQDGTKAPILVTHDGPNRLDLVRNALDNLTISKDPDRRLPAFIVIANWVMANQRTAAALKARGYDYRYVYSRATRHCDRRVFEQTLADTLVWMWRGYRPE